MIGPRGSPRTATSPARSIFAARSSVGPATWPCAFSVPATVGASTARSASATFQSRSTLFCASPPDAASVMVLPSSSRLGQRDVAAVQRAGERDPGRVADQSRHRRHAAGDAERAGHVRLGRAVRLLRRVDSELGVAVQIEPAGRREGGEVGQFAASRWPAASPCRRASPSAAISGWVREKVSGRAGRVEPRVGGQHQRRGFEQVRLGAGDAQAVERRLEMRPRPHCPAGRRRCERIAAPPASSAAIRKVPLASGLANGPRTAASSRTDCQDRPGRGAIAGALAFTVRSAAWWVEIDLALGGRVQRAGGEGKMAGHRVARAVQGGVERDRAEIGQPGEARNEPGSGLPRGNLCPDPGSIHLRDCPVQGSLTLLVCPDRGCLPPGRAGSGRRRTDRARRRSGCRPVRGRAACPPAPARRRAAPPRHAAPRPSPAGSIRWRTCRPIRRRRPAPAGRRPARPPAVAAANSPESSRSGDQSSATFVGRRRRRRACRAVRAGRRAAGRGSGRRGPRSPWCRR